MKSVKRSQVPTLQAPGKYLLLTVEINLFMNIFKMRN